MFSERERSIIKVLGRRKMTLSLIAEEVFFHDRDKPFDAEITINNSISRIIKKCKHHKLEWLLIKEKKRGKLFITKENV